MNRQLTYQDERTDFEKRLAKINAERHPITFLLAGLQDTRNIGSLFRLADAANIEQVLFYKCAISPDDKRINKTARSAQKYVPAVIINNLAEVAALKEKYTLVALEITSQSIPYTALPIEKPLCLIIGSENIGVAQPLLDLADATVHLPMYGINTSMNVAAATGIVTYHFLSAFLAQSAQ